MRETEFRKYLEQDEGISSTVKSVNSKVGKALIVERELNIDFDNFINDEEKVYRLLLQVKVGLNDIQYHGVYQNVVRRYYKFIHNEEFPSLAYCKKKFG
jgi:hypothetical protein